MLRFISHKIKYGFSKRKLFCVNKNVAKFFPDSLIVFKVGFFLTSSYFSPQIHLKLKPCFSETNVNWVIVMEIHSSVFIEDAV